LKDDLPAWLQAAAAFAQVLTGIVALRLAWAANRVSKDNVFVEAIVSQVMNAITDARKVRDQYRALLAPFPDIEKKRAARTAWLQAREAVNVSLADIQELLPEVCDAARAWRSVEDVEAAFVLSDALAPDARVELEARNYEVVHAAFVDALATTMKRLRRR
jgi:hypothetical protein